MRLIFSFSCRYVHSCRFSARSPPSSSRLSSSLFCILSVSPLPLPLSLRLCVSRSLSPSPRVCLRFSLLLEGRERSSAIKKNKTSWPYQALECTSALQRDLPPWIGKAVWGVTSRGERSLMDQSICNLFP